MPRTKVKKSSIADLQAASLFVKAKSENDGASRFKFFLEQSFNRCAVLGLSLAPRQARRQRRVQYPDESALIIGASPAPDELACKLFSKKTKRQGHQHALYHHSTRSRGDVPICQQSRARRGLHLYAM
jgi:hypothetical protein